MSTYTVDDSGQVIITPSELDQFEYYRDNILVRRFQESMDFDYAEIPLPYSDKIFQCIGAHGACHYDASGVWHIVGMGYDAPNVFLVYVTNFSGEWVTDFIIICSTTSRYTVGILLDSSGYIHIFDKEWVSANLWHLYHYTNTTGEWIQTLIGTDQSNSSVWQCNDVLEDSSGNIHFFYSARVGDVWYLKHTDNASGWRTENISSEGLSRFVTAALKPNGDFVVAYSVLSVGVKIAEGTWGSWSTVVATSEDLTGEICIDSDGYAHILGVTHPSSYYLVDVSDKTSSWVSTNLVELDLYQPRFAVAQIDENNYFHVFFTDVATDQKNWIYSNKTGQWVGTSHDPYNGDGAMNSWGRGIGYDGTHTYFVFREIAHGCVLGRV